MGNSTLLLNMLLKLMILMHPISLSTAKDKHY
ncbi:MAG: hypothetical protein IPH45_11920 [Bacteroidales bacterium]|nr:hypothetical protein [Bacteroidales bacterium]